MRERARTCSSYFLATVPVSELCLLDSLCGQIADYDTWIAQDLKSFEGSPPARRFADVYTAGGGTLVNSQQMATRTVALYPPDASVVVDDRTTSTRLPATYAHGLLFELSGLSHDGVVRYYFGKLVETSTLPDRH